MHKLFVHSSALKWLTLAILTKFNSKPIYFEDNFRAYYIHYNCSDNFKRQIFFQKNLPEIRLTKLFEK